MDVWDLTIRFFSMTDSNVRYVVAGAVLLGAASGGIGSFTFLQRRSLLGDTLAHAALPGVCLAFLISGTKNPFYLLVGATMSGWLGALAVNAIVSKTKLKLDTALGIVLTSFFGLGIVMLTSIQKSGSGTQAGLDKFLFGQAAVMGKVDVIILAVIGAAMLIIISICYNQFKLFTFDPGFAGAIGYRIGLLQLLMTTLLVLTVTIGLQAVGVVLMAAMLITPAAAARQWTDKLSTMVALASFFGVLSGLVGAWVSFLAPRFPTGPWMVVTISTIFGISILLAPRRGIISRVRLQVANRRKMTRENLLKSLYKRGTQKRDHARFYSAVEIGRMWSFTSKELTRGLRQLTGQKLLEKEAGQYCLTEQGQHEGARVTRLHRLWEVYLTRYLELPDDHVHRDAEEMEHIITPEVEKRLVEMLDHPLLDPHDQEIPYPSMETDDES